MHRSLRTSIVLTAALAGCLTAQSARADTITAKLIGLNPNTFGDVFLQGSGTLDTGVGNILWQGDSTNPAPFNGLFDTYCVDLIQTISIGNTYTFIEAPLTSAPKSAAFPSGLPTTGMGAGRADEIQEMYGQHLSETLGDTPAAANAREAFQLAIWNILYDTDTSVSPGSGTFYATADISAAAIADANTYLFDAAIPANQLEFPATSLVGLIGQDGAQDQVGINPFVSTADQTPLPSTAAGSTLLFLSLGLLHWRRQPDQHAQEII